MAKKQKKLSKRIYVMPELLDKLVKTDEVSESEKLTYLKFLGYLTKKEQAKFITLI